MGFLPPARPTAPLRAPLRGLATPLATVAGNLYLVLGSLFWASVGLAGAWVPPHGNWVFRCARLWARGLLAVSGVRLAVEHAVPLDPARPVVYMANHQSLYDIPALLASLPGQTRMLAKRSLFRIPFFGWAIAAGGFIAIDREDPGSAPKNLRAAAERLRRGASTVVFPEGTRSLDGRLAPLQRGGFLLALKSGLPIVPVGIEGSVAIRRRGSLVVRPRRLPVRYGAPIAAAEYGLRRREELVAEVRRRLAELARCEMSEPEAAARGC